MRATALRTAFAALLAVHAGAAAALPSRVTLVPPDGARLLEGQRFDVRVEGLGEGPFRATLTLDGRPLPFTSGRQDSVETDGLSPPEGDRRWGGFNARGQVIAAPGPHRLEATFGDASGTVTVSSTVQVVGWRGAGAGVRNVILVLGDGMGMAHRTAARLVRFGATRGEPDGRLEMDALPGTGFVSTHSLDSVVTDSAPGMACYTTGAHAANNQEGVYPAHVTSPFFQPRVEYLAEYLHRVRGTALGLVTTADVEDATPAANAVHTGDRDAGTGIADRYLDEAGATGLSVLLGGGRRWFLPAGAFGSSRAAATDHPALPADLLTGWGLPPAAAGAVDPGRDLLADFGRAGFAAVQDAAGLAAARATPPAKLLGLFAFGNMNPALDKLARRRGTPLPDGGYVVDHYHAPDQPMLDEMTEAALAVLSRHRQGFVLLVEGAHVDKQSHLMDADRAVVEVLELDRAVGVARRFAEGRKDTLVLVLADHECSGFSLVGALTGGVAAARALPSDASVTCPADAPARQGLVGTYAAAGFPRYAIQPDGYPATMDVDGKVLVGFGAGADRFETWLTRPLPVVDSLLPGDLKGELKERGYADRPLRRAADAAGFFLRGQVAGAQAVHTATDVPLSAASPGSEAWRAFVGVQSNTDVFFKIMRAALAGER
ncbi:MAG: alkaline phosphatase [Anaeromyxobacteraceae bacterium]|nr:alkaline phosphatase [Anaeromyxobacteraceae bacterium]